MTPSTRVDLTVRAVRRATLVALVTIMSVCATAASAQSSVVTFSERGPQTAKVSIVEFSDFGCPYCARMPAVIDALLKNNPDTVRLVFKHSPLPIHPKAPLAHEAALAAGAQGKFWGMHDLLFAGQERLEPADLERYATQLQLNLDVFRKALETHEYRPVVARDLAEAVAVGIEGTPTFLINGRRLVGAQTLVSLQAVVDAALTGGPVTTAGANVSPDGINTKGAPTRGMAAAPVTIVAFSDLQCPFCARVNPTLAQLMSQYGGKVKLVFKHFPLPGHVNAPLAHHAALAAGEQGKFWEMHDALFNNQSLATPTGVVGLARSLNLDIDRFSADLVSDRFTTIIERDQREGNALGVDGTPTFFVDGIRVVGARPLSDFTAVIDRALQKHGALDPEAFRSIGPSEAPLTLTWFGDLRSPLNADATRLIKQVVAAYPTKLRLTFKHAPLGDRRESVTAYDSALAAGAQGRFWEMYDLLTLNQTANDTAGLVALAKRLGLDQERFAKDLNERTFRSVAVADLADAQRAGISGTPTFMIDGERIDGVISLEEFKDIIDRYLQRPIAVQR